MISGKRIQASRLLDLYQLGLQPGDELYFYVEAFDNKLPHANRARTETYFITLQDTSSIASALEASLGVHLMPEYFRSQRQIIIDSEKLLKDKKHLGRPTFNSKSNELAYDQKILRLRYGEFLGEEFESGIGPQNSNRGENETNDEAIEKKFGHDHDRGHESHQPEESVAKKSHSHDEAKSLTGAKLSPLEEFVHAHDGDEEATFFVQSIKAKLKAALTIMWDAELYLRLYQPEKSLPYQYKALKLLKEISHESRVYVHRTGFDPPPIKEDKRLTGDLSEISNSTSEQKAEEKQTFPAIRAALSAIEPLVDGDTIVISESAKKVLANAGQELARLELNQPGRYLNALSMLNRILQNQIQVSDLRSTLLIVRSSMWKALPPQSAAPGASSETPHQLTLEFLRSFEKMQHND
jgi:hypothetical protein